MSWLGKVTVLIRKISNANIKIKQTYPWEHCERFKAGRCPREQGELCDTKECVFDLKPDKE